MVVKDPVVLRADGGCDCRRRRPYRHRRTVFAEEFEVLEEPVVVLTLLTAVISRSLFATFRACSRAASINGTLARMTQWSVNRYSG